MPAAIGYGEAASPGGLALGLGGRGGSPVGGRAEPRECQGDSRVRSPAGAHLAALAGRPCVSCGPWRGREAWVCLAWTGRPVRTLPESPGRLWVTAAGVRGAVAQVGEHGPFSPLLARRECPRCPTPSPGSWLRKPLLPRRVALFPSDVYGDKKGRSDSDIFFLDVSKFVILICSLILYITQIIITLF